MCQYLENCRRYVQSYYLSLEFLGISQISDATTAKWMKIDQYFQRQRCKHVELDQFWHAISRRAGLSATAGLSCLECAKEGSGGTKVPLGSRTKACRGWRTFWSLLMRHSYRTAFAPVRLSVCPPRASHSRKRKVVETSNETSNSTTLVETSRWTTVTIGANLSSKGQRSKSLVTKIVKKISFFFAHILIKSGSIYVKTRLKWSPVHSTCRRIHFAAGYASFVVDRTNGRASTVSVCRRRLSVCNVCIVAKRCVLEQTLRYY